MKKLRPNQRRPRRMRAQQTFTRLRAEPLEERRLLTVFTVVNANDSGTGSFRDAIKQANANPGLDLILFDIGGGGLQTIKPLTGLPRITDPVDIDGKSQPGYTDHPLIELDGGAAVDSNGLEFVVGGNAVNGLDIHSFQADGILFAEQFPGDIGNNVVDGNYIGTDPTGTIAEANEEGIHLIHSPNDRIFENVISGNRESGIFVADAVSAFTQITGNLIGTDFTGLLPLGNLLNGVALGAPPDPDPGDGYASDNTVGGLTADDRNVISGNGQSGVWIRGGTGNVVEGNYIGVGKDGVTPLGNGAVANPALAEFGTDGVFIDGASSTEVGGTVDGAGNVISANANDGIRIDASDISASDNALQGNLVGTDKDGNSGLFLGNHHAGVEVRNDSTDSTIHVSRTLIGGADIYDGVSDGIVKARNVISGNVSFGIDVVGHRIDATAILGNYIGTDKLGLTAVQNGQSGIEVSAFLGEDPGLGPAGTIIGDYQPGSPNVISGNQIFGVSIDGGTNTTVERNLVGVDVNELNAVPNGFAGVSVTAGSGVVIGGMLETQFTTSPVHLGNVIAGNTSDGIEIRSGETGAQIVNNYIGISPVSDLLGNGRYGILVSDSPGTIIGGTTADASNFIESNSAGGVVIVGQTSTGSVVQGNYIGVMPNGLPEHNTGDGILISNAPGNLIGGITAGTRNIISSNTGGGVQIDGPFSTANQVIGNYIGTDPTGTRVSGNSGGGVLISGAASGNTIGGGLAALSNVISGNLTAGISLFGGATGNNIINNAIGTDPTAREPDPKYRLWHFHC